MHKIDRVLHNIGAFYKTNYIIIIIILYTHKYLYGHIVLGILSGNKPGSACYENNGCKQTH